VTRVKICSLRRPEHARVAMEAGADMLGIVFAEVPRKATLEQACAIRAAVGPRIEVFEATTTAFGEARDRVGRPLLVGVFANQSADEINRVVSAVDLDVVQLSGEEHPSLAARLIRPVIRVQHVGPDSNAEAILGSARHDPPTVTGLDTKSAQGGGSGRAFDWSIAAAVQAERPLMLSGGLNPENVGTAIETVRPWAADVSSGVETDGEKDMAKIRAFVARVGAVAPAAPGPGRGA
jgi:phosphoribosylanthranilate isomerase